MIGIHEKMKPGCILGDGMLQIFKPGRIRVLVLIGICSIHEISRDSFSSIDLINYLVPLAQRSRARSGSCIPRTDHLYSFDIDSIRNNK
jgi:hypothetical protein